MAEIAINSTISKSVRKKINTVMRGIYGGK
jgi:hypothetical protein